MFKYEGLAIRGIEKEDLPFLLELRKEAWPFLGTIGILSLSMQEDWLQAVNKDQRRSYYILINEENARIGLVRMDEIDFINRSIRVGGDLRSSFRGRGYGQKMMGLIKKYCFNYLNMNRLWLLVLETNEAALHIYKKSGFVLEGAQREAILRNGKHIDYLMMSLLRTEFLEE